MGAAKVRQVRKRRVFYIPGYDPIPPRRYRELYRKESAAQAVISGYEIGITPATGRAHYGWNIQAEIEDARTDSDMSVLVWSDIVRQSMSPSIVGTYLQLIRTAWVYISTGTLWRLMRLRKGPIIAALYPVGMLLVQLIIAFLLGMVVWGVCRKYIGDWPAIIPEVLTVYGLLYWFRRMDNRFFAYYLMHDYAYGAATRGAYPPSLETRLAEFSDTIAGALDEDWDEVLVVGHSSGAHLAVSILADLIRAGRVPSDGPALSLLSLGQVVPMVSFLPDADRLRGDLHLLSQSDQITWVDISAPGDGCAFALCDPVAVSGVTGPDKKWPLVLSAAFTQTLSPERWRALRWRFFRLHFQYLCAFDRPGSYDYFSITAGPQTLAARFAGRAPSKSRIERAVNKFTSQRPGS